MQNLVVDFIISLDGLSRSLLQAGLVGRYRVVVFPVITGATGSDRIFDGYPDVALDLADHRTFDEDCSSSSTTPEFSLPHPAPDADRVISNIGGRYSRRAARGHPCRHTAGF